MKTTYDMFRLVLRASVGLGFAWLVVICLGWTDYVKPYLARRWLPLFIRILCIPVLAFGMGNAVWWKLGAVDTVFAEFVLLCVLVRCLYLCAVIWDELKANLYARWMLNEAKRLGSAGLLTAGGMP